MRKNRPAASTSIRGDGMVLQGSGNKRKRKGVLIGGSGLIGGTLVHYFKTAPAKSFDIRAPSSKKLSIRVTEDILSYLQEVQPDFIINTAITDLGADSQLAFEVNYLGPLNLARAAAAMGIPYIHMSSAATLPNGLDLDEDDQLPFSARMSNYAKSKLMAEKTLRYMAKHEGLDYTCIRLAVVYGTHDHKIQGFHRMFFTIADESMPCLFTKKGIMHSYTNARKLPYFVHHVLNHRQEFTGRTYHFVDREPVELVDLILTLKSYLQVKTPAEIYIPYPVAKVGKKVLTTLLRLLGKIGLKATLPPELMFLDNFYKSQTLSNRRLHESSFIDPFPRETIYTRLPELVIYYLTRWSHQNLITTYDEEMRIPFFLDREFVHSPDLLLRSIHEDSTKPFSDMTNRTETPASPP
jgi:GlcNAc-P-P-Und epimerase